MEENIFFSIIIPSFNRAHIIKKTIDSFLQQSYKNFELIVIDDGSTDNTKEVIESIKDDRLTYCWKENAERGAARNYGASLAKGKYLNFFDSDDIAYPNHLDNASKKLNELNFPDFYYQLGEIKDPFGKVLASPKIPGRPEKRILKENFLLPNGVFLSPQAFNKIKYSETRELSGSEDALLYILMFMENKFYYDKTITHALINHEGRSMNNVSLNSLHGRHTALLKELLNNTTFVNRYGNAMIKSIDVNFLQHIAIQMAVQGKSKIGFYYLRRAVKKSFKALFTKNTLIFCKYIAIHILKLK